MLELTSNKKNKVTLSDYNFEKDIENRSLLADLSFFEYDVVQEIFFSPTKFSKGKFAKTLDTDEKTLSPVLEKLEQAGLLTLDGDLVQVDKEMRKFFEFHMRRFEPDFKCDMEYLQGILRKVPIHILPTWYSIPRTSNNIFESIVEKHLLTPNLFKRYLLDLSFAKPIAREIMEDVFNSPDFRISSSDIITKYNLSRHEFEETLLCLEFSFVCSTSYTRGDDIFLEWVTPFHEWYEYLNFIKNNSVSPIPKESEVCRDTEGSFAYAKLLSKSLAKVEIDTVPKDHIEKLLLLELIEKKKGGYAIVDAGKSFLDLEPEKQAIHLYRHPYNKVLNPEFPLELSSEKNNREIEKSLKRILSHGWVFFDEFVKGALICFNEAHSVVLKKIGKSWKYDLPSHSGRELKFIKHTIFESFFEAGIVDIGVCEGRDCFRVTPFGRSLFEE